MNACAHNNDVDPPLGRVIEEGFIGAHVHISNPWTANIAPAAKRSVKRSVIQRIKTAGAERMGLRSISG